MAGYFLHCCASSVPSRGIGGREEYGGIERSREEGTCCPDNQSGLKLGGLYMHLPPPKKGKGNWLQICGQFCIWVYLTGVSCHATGTDAGTGDCIQGRNPLGNPWGNLWGNPLGFPLNAGTRD